MGCLINFLCFEKVRKLSYVTIQKNLKFLARYVKAIDINVHKRVIDIFENTNLYNSSFDIFHLAFCEYNNSKLITFDKGFKKFKEISKADIVIYSVLP
jgi:predicted nucleic acid-binding protein